MLVISGELRLERNGDSWNLTDALTLMAVAKNTLSHVQKTPGKQGGEFKSVFLALSTELIAEFHQSHGHGIDPALIVEFCTTTPLNNELSDTLHYCLRGIDAKVSPEQQRHRLLGLLLALKECGVIFPRPSLATFGERLSRLLRTGPEKAWTAAHAGPELAVSEATLRRRLAEEGTHFSHLLTEIRMHHAMMLLQTSHLGVSQIADACGYRALSRFSMRFKRRFGCSPNSLR